MNCNRARLSNPNGSTDLLTFQPWLGRKNQWNPAQLIKTQTTNKWRLSKRVINILGNNPHVTEARELWALGPS